MLREAATKRTSLRQDGSQRLRTGVVMEYVFYALGVLLRLIIMPLWLIQCVYVYLMAVYKEKGVKVYVDESRDFGDTDGTNNSPGSAGVDDTLSALRAKAGLTVKA